MSAPRAGPGLLIHLLIKGMGVGGGRGGAAVTSTYRLPEAAGFCVIAMRADPNPNSDPGPDAPKCLQQ